MQLLEYQAKNILKKFHIAVPQGKILDDDASFEGGVILKVQVPTGKRGKAGGVVKVSTKEEFSTEYLRLKELEVDGFKTEAILSEELASFEREHYFSLMVDRASSAVRLVARIEGGVDVEESDGAVLSEVVYKNSLKITAEKLRLFYGYDEHFSQEFEEFVAKAYDCIVGADALLLEINPLVVSEGSLLALDCKMELDDNALYRHNDFAAHAKDANFVLLDEQGDTAVIANGAGLAMATVDQVNQAGLVATNFLDIGGGANTEAITKQFARLAALPNLKAIIVNIFAGITQCDQVAAAIVAARENIASLPPLYIRLHGTNYDEAKNILDKANIGLYGSLKECIEAAHV